VLHVTWLTVYSWLWDGRYNYWHVAYSQWTSPICRDIHILRKILLWISYLYQVESCVYTLCFRYLHFNNVSLLLSFAIGEISRISHTYFWELNQTVFCPPASNIQAVTGKLRGNHEKLYLAAFRSSQQYKVAQCLPDSILSVKNALYNEIWGSHSRDCEWSCLCATQCHIHQWGTTDITVELKASTFRRLLLSACTFGFLLGLASNPADVGDMFLRNYDLLSASFIVSYSWKPALRQDFCHLEASAVHV
jgi:hypothetical protein